MMKVRNRNWPFWNLVKQNWRKLRSVEKCVPSREGCLPLLEVKLILIFLNSINWRLVYLCTFFSKFLSLIWVDQRAAVRAWCMSDDPIKLQEFAFDRKYSRMQVWGPFVENHPLIDERREEFLFYSKVAAAYIESYSNQKFRALFWFI